MSEDTNKPQQGQRDSGNFQRDKDMMGSESKFRGKRRRKVSYLTLNKIETVDYKDVNILRRFINDRGKILPSRQSGNTAKQQRMIARAIRRAREMALLPFVVAEMSPERREFGPRRDRGDRPGGRDYRDRGGDRDQGPREPREPREQAPAASEAAAAPAPAATE